MGIAPEGNSNEYMYFHNNINAFNQIGVWMLYNNDTPNQFSNPRLEQNNVWQNYCKGPPIPNTIVDYLKGDWTVGGPWIVTDQYAPQNFPTTNFRNISIPTCPRHRQRWIIQRCRIKLRYLYRSYRYRN